VLGGLQQDRILRCCDKLRSDTSSKGNPTSSSIPTAVLHCAARARERTGAVLTGMSGIGSNSYLVRNSICFDASKDESL
jgi:hypothetical protein